jgi:signal transduction histidine kinase
LVSNLIVNAVQYTPAGGIVTIILERSDRHAIIRVRDTGIGIAASQQKRIFDRSRHTGGLGLGLAIAKAIAEWH